MGDKQFSLPTLWSLLIFHYPMRAEFDGRRRDVVAGTCALLPPGAHKRYQHRRLGLRHHVVHFTCSRGAAPVVELPRLVDLDGEYASATAAIDRIVSQWPTQPAAATAHCWDLLWRLAERHQPNATAGLVDRARQAIDQQLGDPACSIQGIAAVLGVSHGHLCTRFRAELGCRPRQWLRRRRAERAQHLLRHSTLPGSAIAAEVGLPDVQALNKLCRGVLGRSPRQIRTGNCH